MPSIAATLLKLQLRLAKPLVRFTGIEASRAAQDHLGDITARLLKDRVSYEPVPFTNFLACYAVPHALSAEDRVILYLHGGGYTAGSLDYAKGFGGLLASSTHLKTFCAAYRLAPENRFPAALDDAYDAYRFLLDQGYDPAHIAFAGESAGGGLIYCLAHRCRQEGTPLPACMVGISPWTDLTMSGKSYQNNVLRDPSLIREALAYYVIVYAAGHEDEALVSPILGDFHGFPPAMLFAGSDEILLDDARSLYKKLIAAGCKASLTVEPGMWHVYPLYGTPEGKRALRRMSAFLRQKLGLSDLPAQQ